MNNFTWGYHFTSHILTARRDASAVKSCHIHYPMQLRVVISSAVSSSSSSPGPGYHQQWAGDSGDTGTTVILTSCKSFHLFKSFFSESIDPLLQIIDNTQNTIRIQLHFTKSTCPVSSSTQQPGRSWPSTVWYLVSKIYQKTFCSSILIVTVKVK